MQPDTRLGAVFIKPGATLASFTSVLLDPVQISFASDWDPNRTCATAGARLTPADITILKAGLADLFRETFRAELERSGYPLGRRGGSRNAARHSGHHQSLRDCTCRLERRTLAGLHGESGRMTLVAELRDSVTNELLARAVDARAARSAGAQLTWSTRVTNSADARRAIGVWAAALVRGLDGVYGKPVPPEAAAAAAAPAS